MAGETEKSAFERIAEILQAHEVEFIVVGGQAELLHGSPRVTYDIDLCYQRSPANLERLAQALRKLNPQLRNAPPWLAFPDRFEISRIGRKLHLSNRPGDLYLLGHLEPLGGFEALAKRAATYDVGGLLLKVIHLDDLIAIKQYIGRPKERQSLLQLRAIKKVRQEE